MNDDTITLTGTPTIGDITISDGGYAVYTGNGLAPLTMATSSTVTIGGVFDMEDLLDQHIMNRITIDHKVQEQELMKLKETVPTYADEIKENLSKNAARDIMKKMTFTKKHDKDADVHHFLGRVWVFTEDELKSLINEVRNA